MTIKSPFSITKLMIIFMILSWHVRTEAHDLFSPEVVASWNAFSRTAQRAGNVRITALKLDLQDGMIIRLSPVGIRHGVAIVPGEDPPAELFQIISIENLPKPTESGWGVPGNYLSLFWRKFNVFEKWMFRDAHLQGWILYITVLSGPAIANQETRLKALVAQAGYTYV